jgi:hypothetical protein
MPNAPLQPWQVQGLKKATAAGNTAQYLQAHPGVQNRMNFLQGSSNPTQQARAATLTGQPAPGSQTQAPQGSGQTGSTKPSADGQTAAPTTPAPTTPAPTTPAAPTPPASWNDALNTTFGAGQPFGLQSWYGGNPITTAQQAATQNLGTNLAGIRNNYAGAGMGTSAQEALAEGTAAAQMNTQLGANLAQQGIGARAGDLTTALNAILGAGQQQLQGQQNQIQAQQGLGQLGQILTQIGATEQGIPNANLIATILGLYTQQGGAGGTQTHQTQKAGGGG